MSSNMLQQKWIALATVVAEKASKNHGLHRYVPKSKTVDRVNFRYLMVRDSSQPCGFTLTFTVVTDCEFGKILAVGSISKRKANWQFRYLCASENPAFYELCKLEAEQL